MRLFSFHWLLWLPVVFAVAVFVIVSLTFTWGCLIAMRVVV
jgi:hypothetical protein